MTLLIVTALAALIGLTIMFRLGRDGRRIHDRFDAPIPGRTPMIQYRVSGGQDPIAVVLALRHAGYLVSDRYLHGDVVVDIAVHTGSTHEREAIRSTIFAAPTLEDAEYHPAAVVFVDEEPGPMH